MDQEIKILEKLMQLPRFSNYQNKIKKYEIFRTIHGDVTLIILVKEPIEAMQFLNPIRRIINLMQLKCNFDFAQYLSSFVFDNIKNLCMDPEPTNKKMYDALGILLDEKGYIIGRKLLLNQKQFS